jgi:hypothetical protein
MGYVNDKEMSQMIPIESMSFVTGTWVPTLASNVVSSERTSADSSSNIFVPIPIPSNEVALKGAKLKSIDVYYNIAVAALDDFATVELEKIVLEVDGTIPTGAAVSITLDTAHDTAAERKALDEHKMTVTLDTPVWIDDNEVYYLYMVIDSAATSDFGMFPAVAHYELRV